MPPGEALPDTEIIGGLFTRLRAMYQKDGGAFPDPIVNLSWTYTRPGRSRRRKRSRGR